MYWTLELASKLEDAPWPATKEELIDYATRSGAPLEVIENLEEIEMKAISTSLSKRFGPITLLKKISSGTRRNINICPKVSPKKAHQKSNMQRGLPLTHIALFQQQPY
jgi:hypothetical protein